MRKCGSCGYLLLGEADTCGRCGAPLAVVLAGAGTRAPTAAVPAAAPPAASPPPTWAPPPPPGEPAPALREPWELVNVVAPRSRSPRATRLGIVAVAIVVALAVGLGAMHFRSDPLPAGTSAFVAGNGVTYTSADGAFQVQLPTAPAVEQSATVLNGMPATISAAATTSANYVISATSIDFTSSLAAAQVNDLLGAALSAESGDQNGKLVHKTLMMRDSLPAIEGHFNASDGYRAYILVVASGSTLIMLIVHSKTGTGRLYKALEDSLIVR
jgi:hypothetical protein